MEFGLLAAAVAAIGCGWLVLRLTNASQLFDTVLTASVVGLFAGRVAAMVIGGTNPLTRPLDLLIVRGGVDTVAASAAALLWFGWVARKDLWRAADAAAPAVTAALAAWHASCVTGSACLGTPSDLPWAWAATHGGVTRHPTELYAVVALALAAVVLTVIRDRARARPGALAAAALTVVALVRFATEPLRVTIGPGPDWWYATGVVVGAALLVWRVRGGSGPREG
jgi:prolipoprotein diacylglyceryltransferase